MPTYYAEVNEASTVSPGGADGPDGPTITFELDRPRLAGVLVQAAGMVADPGGYPFNHLLVFVSGSAQFQVLDFFEDRLVAQTSRSGSSSGDQVSFGGLIVVPLEPGPHELRLTYLSQVSKASIERRRLWVTLFD